MRKKMQRILSLDDLTKKSGRGITDETIIKHQRPGEVLRAVEVVIAGADRDARAFRVRDQRQGVLQVFQRVPGARLHDDPIFRDPLRRQPAPHLIL